MEWNGGDGWEGGDGGEGGTSTAEVCSRGVGGVMSGEGRYGSVGVRSGEVVVVEVGGCCCFEDVQDAVRSG